MAPQPESISGDPRSLDPQPEVPVKPTEQRSRSTVCLLLFVLFSMGARNSTPASDPTAQDSAYMIGRAIGSALPAFICLLLGTYFAFRDRRPVARVISSALVLLFAVGIGTGIQQGLSRNSAGELMISEAATARAGLFADLSGEGTVTEFSDNHDRRLREMAHNLETSGNEDAAVIGRAMRIAADLIREPDLALATTLDKVSNPQFLDVVWMLEHDDLEGQLDLAEEYLEISSEGLVFYQLFSPTLSQALRDADIPKHAIAEFVAGVNRIRPTQLKVYEAHVLVAESYLELITFVAEHPGNVVLYEDGGFDITPEEALAAFYDIHDPMGAAEKQLDAALDAHVAAMNGL